MLAVTEPGVHIITTMVCTQLLKTSILENVFGFYAHLDPCPILLLQPKEDAAEQFSKERISPLIRVTPVLRKLVGTAKTRNADETLLFKSFPGGFLALAGAGSPDNLARRPIRVLLADEVDKYPVTREGDPIALAEERTATFGVNWLSIRACSPTIQDESRIERSYLASDMRRASVACPSCGHRQFLDFFRHVDWDKRKDEKGNVVEHLPKTARIFCEACNRGWSEGDRLRALQTTRFHQTKPFDCCGHRHIPLEQYEKVWRDAQTDGLSEADASQRAVDATWDWWSSDRHGVYRAKCPDCGKWAVDNEHAGFQAGKLFSPWAKDKPSNIAAKWLTAKDDEDLKQAWWNTQAGMPYRPNSGKNLNLEVLAARGETWPAEIPAGVGVLTAGVDVQDDRLECEVVGWGHDEESWSIDYEVFEGDPGTPELWKKVDAYLKRTWYRYDGRAYTISSACIDSGGHNTQMVYEFAKARLGRRIYAIKGESARNGQRSPVWPAKKPTRRNKGGYRPTIIGVNTAKDTVRHRLEKETPGPGYMHFPADRDINYYAQLTSERIVVKQASGHKFRVWELPAGRANEALDCRVYAYAALCAMLHFGLHLNRVVEHAQEPVRSRAPDEIDDDPADEIKPPRKTGPVIKTKTDEKKRSIASRLA